MKTITQNKWFLNFKTATGLFFLIILMQSCFSVAPVTTSVESARLVEKGKTDVSVMRSSYSTKVEKYEFNGNTMSEKSSSMEKLNTNTGFKIVVGGNKSNFGFHYEHMAGHEYNEVINYFAIEPKFKMYSDESMSSAFSVPFGIYMPENHSGGSTIYQLMPAFHFTFSGSKYFEFNFSPKAIFILNDFPSTPFLNMTAGIGLSSNLKQWGIRPEVGYTISPSGGNGIIQTAIGLSFTF